jgi:hypothetical protein
MFYLLNERGALTLVRQELDAVSKQPLGTPARLATAQVFPPLLLFSLGAPFSTVSISSDRVFFNTVAQQRMDDLAQVIR